MPDQATTPAGAARLTQPGGAADPARAAGLGDDALPHLPAGGSVADALDALLAAGLAEDAVRLLAHALPPREAVWWAGRCSAQAPRPPAAGPPSEALAAREAAASAAEEAARAAAERWCGDPTDAHRRAAHAAGEAAAGSPAGLAAMSGFFADGSVTPADCPAVPPPPGVCQTLAAGAVLLAAVRGDPEGADARRRAFLDLGRQVADGGDRWAEARPVAPPTPARTGPLRPPAPPKPPANRSYY